MLYKDNCSKCGNTYDRFTYLDMFCDKCYYDETDLFDYGFNKTQNKKTNCKCPHCGEDALVLFNILDCDCRKE